MTYGAIFMMRNEISQNGNAAKGFSAAAFHDMAMAFHDVK